MDDAVSIAQSYKIGGQLSRFFLWGKRRGSSCLATLGSWTESRWDSRTERDSASRSRFANTEMVGCFRRTLHAEVLRVAEVADQLCSACKTPPPGFLPLL